MKLRGSSINKFVFDIQQVTESDYYKVFTDKNSLLTTHPGTKDVTLLQEARDYVWESMPSLMGDKIPTPFVDMLNRGRSVVVDTEYVEWTMMTRGGVYCESIEDTGNGDSCPGIQSTYFYVKLNTNKFQESDIIAPLRNPNYLARIAEAPKNAGDGWYYTLQLVTNTPANDFFPPELLVSGLRWKRMYSPKAEASNLWGSWSSEATGFIRFRVPMSSHTQEGKITDDALALNVYFGPAGDNGMVDLGDRARRQGKILPVLMMHFDMDFDAAVENALIFGRLSDKVLIDRSSGKGVVSGAGLMEYFESGPRLDIGNKDAIIPKIKEAMRHMFNDRIPWQSRYVEVNTGTIGLEDASGEIAQMWYNIGNDKANDEIVKNRPSAVGNFSTKSLQPHMFDEVVIPLVGTVRFNYWPILDSPEVFTVIDPSTGLPLESGNYYIFDVGVGMGANSNLSLYRRSGEINTFRCGVVSPVGPINTQTGIMKGFPSTHKGRHMEWDKQMEFGLRMRDTSRAVKLERNVC